MKFTIYRRYVARLIFDCSTIVAYRAQSIMANESCRGDRKWMIFTIRIVVIETVEFSSVCTEEMATHNESDEQKYDDVFMQISGQIGSIQGLLDYFFGFMHRKTDFYVQYANTMQEASMGFPIGAAERMVTKCFRKYKMKDYASLSTVPINETVISISEATRVSSIPTVSSAAKAQINRTDANPKSQQIPVGNGGVADNYYWTQTLNEVTVYVDAPTACRGKDVKCNMTHKSIYLSVNGKTLLGGEFEEGIRVDESIWTLNIGMSRSLLSTMILISVDRKLRYLNTCQIFYLFCHKTIEVMQQ